MKNSNYVEILVAGIADILKFSKPIMLDVQDINIVAEGKTSMAMSIGVGYGKDKVLDALRMALKSPAVSSSIEQATGVLICYSGEGMQDEKYCDNLLQDVSECGELIRNVVHPYANIIFGTSEKIIEKDGTEATLMLFFD